MALIKTVRELEDFMSTPDAPLIGMMGRLTGDILILGAGGKMGITLAMLAKRAVDAAGVGKKVIAVSRFSNPATKEQLTREGVETISCDLMNESELKQLPDAENVVFMAGTKFGSTGKEAETWATNVFLPGIVAQQFRNSRFAVFSSGNVYPMVSIKSGGCVETDSPNPIGDYAQSVLGRERIFEYFSRKFQIACVTIRLNYAIDLRYGVLYDLARSVFDNKPVNLTMGHANVIWQGDANSITLRSLEHAKSPPMILNLTGSETVSIRKLAKQFGEIYNIEPIFTGTEAETAFLSNNSLSNKLFGPPSIQLEDMINLVAHWVREDLPSLNKPTHFQTRDGKF